jgi:hypothetical protein
MISPDALVISISTILTIGGQQFYLYRKSRRDSSKRDEKLDYILSEFPSHLHTEKDGVSLTEAGILYPTGTKRT